MWVSASRPDLTSAPGFVMGMDRRRFRSARTPVELESLSKPLGERIEAHERAGDGGEHVVDVEPAFVADGEAAKLVEPCRGSLDDAAMTTKLLAGVDASSGDARPDLTCVGAAAVRTPCRHAACSAVVGVDRACPGSAGRRQCWESPLQALDTPWVSRRRGGPLVIMLHGCTQSPDDFGVGAHERDRRGAAISSSSTPGRLVQRTPRGAGIGSTGTTRRDEGFLVDHGHHAEGHCRVCGRSEAGLCSWAVRRGRRNRDCGNELPLASSVPLSVMPYVDQRSSD